MINYSYLYRNWDLRFYPLIGNLVYRGYLVYLGYLLYLEYLVSLQPDVPDVPGVPHLPDVPIVYLLGDWKSDGIAPEQKGPIPDAIGNW